MACGFCRKSLEGLKVIEKPKDKEKELDGIDQLLSELKIESFGSDPKDKVVQCQMCQEYWREESDIVIKAPPEGGEERPLVDSDMFGAAPPEFVIETKAIPLGYDKNKIWED